jgi:hypothetical protein
MVKLTLNTFNDVGFMTGTKEVGLSIEQIQDIIDHAVQLCIVSKFSITDQDNVMDEMEEALAVAGII